MGNYPKWQISKFINGDRNIQEVFRSDDDKEYEQVRTKWLKEVEARKEIKEMTAPAPADTQLCPIHKVQMTGKEGKYGRFYSHRTETGWCNGKPKVKQY